MMEQETTQILASLLNDPGISEILVNGPDTIFVERRGRLERSDQRFTDTDHVLREVAQVVAPECMALSAATPVMQVVLPDRSLVTVIVPPVAVSGVSVTIRKFHHDWLTMENLLRFGSLNEEMVAFLRACFLVRRNVVVSGGTGSGKTTVLNILTELIPDDERVVTIEEIASLQVRTAHVVALQRQPPGSSEGNRIGVADLVRIAAWMRPERVILGEVSGEGLLEALQLMGHGHDGSMLLVHATSPDDALVRLEMMIKFVHTDLPVAHLRSLIGSSVELIVHASRLSDGSRKVDAITEVVPSRGGEYTLHPVFHFHQTGTNEQGKIVGEFRRNEISERLAQRFQAYGIFLPGVMKNEE